MKLLTMSVAADRLGWDFTYTHPARSGRPHRPTASSTATWSWSAAATPRSSRKDFGPAPLFSEWAAAARRGHPSRGRPHHRRRPLLRRRRTGRGMGVGLLERGYAAPSGGLATTRTGRACGSGPAPHRRPAPRRLSPPGHGCSTVNDRRRRARRNRRAASTSSRLPDSPRLTVPAGAGRRRRRHPDGGRRQPHPVFRRRAAAGPGRRRRRCARRRLGPRRRRRPAGGGRPARDRRRAPRCRCRLWPGTS